MIHDVDGMVQRNKAMLVAKGYSQQQGVDYNETFALIARLDTIRTLITLAGQNSWLLYQFDAKSVFLNGEFKQEVYVEQPEALLLKVKKIRCID